MRGAVLVAVCAAAVGAALSLANSSDATDSVLDGPPDEARILSLGETAGAVRHLKDPKLDSHLVALADAAADAQAAGRSLTASTPQDALPVELRTMISARLLRLTDAGQVQVYIISADPPATVGTALVALGVQVERVDAKSGIIQAQVPVGALRQVANLPGVRWVRLPDYAVVNAGAILTEGDAVMNSDDVRSTFGIDGAGVTVGVISGGVAGLADAQASGDLPAVDTSTCAAFGGSGFEGEGTAMLEIVHDIAPGASLMFGNFSPPGGLGTDLDFNAAVDCLAANADVVVDDIAFFNTGPYDGTSPVSQNTADALNGPGPIRGYYTSVGNYAGQHYQGAYVDSGLDLNSAGPTFWSVHSFDVSGGAKGTKNALGTTPLHLNRFVLAPGGSASFRVVWDDPWGTSANDYDLFFREALDIIYICVFGNRQDGVGGNDFPVELCNVANTTGGDVEYDILIGNWEDSADPVEFDMFLICSGCIPWSNGNLLDFNTAGSSVPNQSDAGGSPVSVTSLGAVRHSSPDTIESFSSRGLTNDGRLKPDLVAPDGTCITGAGGFGQGSCQGTGSQFFGTSAAAPHAAAVAALLLACDSALTRAQLRDALLNSAVDLGDGGPDNVYGFGRINAFAAASAVGCSAAPPTPTPTPTVEGPTTTPTETVPGPTPTATSTPTATTTASAGTATATATATTVGVETATATATIVGVETATATATATTATATVTASATVTATATASATRTPTPTNTPIPTATHTPSPTPRPALRGDATCDGLINAVDALFILQLFAGLLANLPCDQNADVNGSGAVDVIDAALILQLSAGFIDTLAAGQGWAARIPSLPSFSW